MLEGQSFILLRFSCYSSRPNVKLVTYLIISPPQDRCNEKDYHSIRYKLKQQLNANQIKATKSIQRVHVESDIHGDDRIHQASVITRDTS